MGDDKDSDLFDNSQLSFSIDDIDHPDISDYISDIYSEVVPRHKPSPPSVDELDANRRYAARLGRISRILDSISAPDESLNPEEISGRDFDTVVYEYLTAITAEGSTRGMSLAVDLFLDRWRSLEAKEQQRWAVVLIALARDSSVRATIRRLEERPELANQMKFDDGIPHHSTISRNVTLDDDTEELLQPFVKRMRHAALRMGATIPDSLAEDYGLAERLTADVTMAEKMETAEQVLTPLLVELLPHIGFDRDPEAPNYSYPPEVFYVLLAHLALERSYTETGARTLQWMDGQLDVPEGKTLFRYIRKYTVDEIDDKFAAATGTLLDHVDLPEPAHLAYDVTNVLWYGDSTAYWPSGVLAKNNTSDAWQFAVLSVAHPQHTYILGALPLRSESEVDTALRRLLRRAIERFDVSVGRVYMDSQMARSGVIEAVRNVDADYLIRAPDDGAVSDLLDDATTDQPEWETNLPFSDFSSARRPNAFAYPISSEEVGGQNQKRDHKAFLTDMKVNDRDLRGLAYQYRSRWRIETAIRQLKNRFHPRTRAADGEIRTWFFATAALFYNLYSYVNTVVPGNLSVLSRDAHLSGEEFLHVFRKGEFVGHLHT